MEAKVGGETIFCPHFHSDAHGATSAPEWLQQVCTLRPCGAAGDGGEWWALVILIILIVLQVEETIGEWKEPETFQPPQAPVAAATPEVNK